MAWGYAFRAIGHTILTIATLGILLPRQTFWLEKYITDRSWYGDAKFEQTGKWTELYPAMKHIFIGIAIVIVGTGGSALLGLPGLAATLGFVGYAWLLVGFVHYRVRSFVYLTGAKVLDDAITFEATPSTATIDKRILLGGHALGLLMGLVFAVLGFALAVVLEPAFQALQAGNVMGFGIAAVLLVVAYVAALAVAGALVLVWITQPIIAHVIMSITVKDAEALNRIRQRAADSGADAEGFADALDVGGAI